MRPVSLLFATGTLCLLSVACSKPTETDVAVSAVDISETIGHQSQSMSIEMDVMQKWTRSCALCHVTGVAGAPRAGVGEEWESRLAAGKPILLKHTIEGYNNMPPLGYCMACEEDDFIDLIDFMLGESP